MENINFLEQTLDELQAYANQANNHSLKKQIERTRQAYENELASRREASSASN